MVCKDAPQEESDRLGDVPMIYHQFIIWQHDWLVKAYINTDVSDAREILDELWSLGADMDTMRKAYKNLYGGLLNTGLTYTSGWCRETVLVISKTTSALEFINSLTHELDHAKNHICKCRGIDLNTEEASYFIGGLARDLFPHVKHLLCESCRDKIMGCHCEH